MRAVAAKQEPRGTARLRRWSSESERALVGVIFPARHAAIVAVSAIVPFADAVGDRRWPLVAFALLVLLPLDIVFHRWARRHGRFPAAMPILNQLLASAVVAASPVAFAAVALLLLADNAFTALVFGRRFAVIVTSAGSALLGITALVVDVEDIPVVLGAVAVSSFATAWIVGDVGERERAAANRYADLVGEVDVIVWEMVPGTDQFRYVSPAATSMFGYPIDDWYVPGFWLDHLHADDAERVLAELQDVIASGREHTVEYRMLDVDGRAVHVRDVASVERDNAGEPVLVRGVMVDISDRRRAEELLREQATHDPLTGLPNRALLGDHLNQALKEARRTGDRVALLLLDLDEFKEVNDALGHDAGDLLLTAFATRLRNEVRECDTIARLGGDEFALLLTTDADIPGATAVAERVRAIAERPFDLDGLHLQTRASIGIAVFPDHAADAAALSARADVAMYLAKRSGRGSAVYEPELDHSSVRRLSLLGHLREAIAFEQLDLGFQPCFDLRTGRVVSVEALVRWTHPEHGPVGPEEFIRLAEMSGLIQPLSRWVIGRAVDVVTDLTVPLQLSANLSVRNLTEPDLVEWLADLVDRKRLRPGSLVLELTETEVMTDVDAASAVLRDIAALGIELAVDDFGSGQSALAYLRMLPVHELKLDRSLVDDVGSNKDGAVICAAVVDLAHRLGLRVVAEGAGNEQDVGALREMGCDRAQGYFLAAPGAVDDLASLAGRTVEDAIAGAADAFLDDTTRQ